MTVLTQQLPTGTWSVDPVHSSAAFRVRHLGVSTFRAGFTDVRGAFTGDGETARVTGVVGVESISITQPDFRGHVLAEDFFDAERHPELRFESTAIGVEGDGLRVEGDLTIRGITRSVVASGRASDPADDPYGRTRFALELSAEIDRRDFALAWQAQLPGGGLAVDYPVTLEVALELIREES